MNKFQKLLVKHYENGEFKHVETQAGADNVGDGLFSFLFRELSDKEHCDCWEDALGRLHTTKSQLDSLACAMRQAEYADSKDS